MPMMSFSALKLYSLLVLPIQDFLNLAFGDDDGRPAGTPAAGTGVALAGRTGVEAPELGAVVEVAEPLDGIVGEELVVGMESTESEREVLDRFGNMDGILKPGESGLGAWGVFAIVAGVGVTGDDSVAGTGDGTGEETRRGSIVTGSAESGCEGGMYKFTRRLP